MDDWFAYISRVRNGFIITTADYSEEGAHIVRRDVLMELKGVSDSDKEAEMAKDLCDYIIAYFDMGGSKHDIKRINVQIRESK